MSDGGGASKSIGAKTAPGAHASSVNGTHAWTTEEGPRAFFRGPKKPLLAGVLSHGDRDVYIGLALGALVTLVIHGIASVRAETALFDMLHYVHDTEKDMHDYFWATYEIEPQKVDKKDEPPPEPPPPPPEVKDVAPVAQQQIIKPDDPYKDAPPPTKIAEAQPLVTQGEDPYDGVATGNNPNATGLQAGAGTEKHGDTMRTGPAPASSGIPAQVAAAPPREDHSKPPTIAGGSAWSCPFPPEADADGRDSAVATIVVTVRPDGTPGNVAVIADPGSGFGRAAKQCALGRRYQAGLDRDGNPTTATTPPIRVRFSR